MFFELLTQFSLLQPLEQNSRFDMESSIWTPANKQDLLGLNETESKTVPCNLPWRLLQS